MFKRLILGGGGDATDAYLVDKFWLNWLDKDAQVVYWPFALERDSYKSGFHWFTSTYEPLGLRNIQMWTDFDHEPKELDSVDTIYIGGGNTFQLLHLLRSSGFDEALTEFILQGKAVYGGSAGAIILGRDIQPAAHIDPNDVHLTNLNGLNLIEGYSVWCHYTVEDDERIYRYISQTQYPVLALPERAGVAVEGNKIMHVGYEPVTVFKDGQKHELPSR